MKKTESECRSQATSLTVLVRLRGVLVCCSVSDVTTVHADCDVATLSKTAGLHSGAPMAPTNKGAGGLSSDKMARALQQSVHGLYKLRSLPQLCGTRDEGQTLCNDIHIPVSTCVQHMTSIIYRALHHSVERNKEPTDNITNLNVSALPE